MKLSLIILSQVFFFIKIKAEDDLNLKGGYRIDSILNNNSLTEENIFLQFFREKDKNKQIFKFNKTRNNTYYIETKIAYRNLAVNQNGHVLIFINKFDQYLNSSTEWNIFKNFKLYGNK